VTRVTTAQELRIQIN